jgi:glycosyltransferase involved in cell wall biosynthesis
MTEKNKTLFLALDTYSRVGGIQRFNQRLINMLKSLRGETGLTVLLMRDATKDIPTEAHSFIQGFGSSRLGFIKKALTEARKVRYVLLGHVNLLPLGFLIKLISPSTKIVLFVHGDEVWNSPPYRKMKIYEPLLARCVTQVASVSKYTAEIMSREFKLPIKRFTIFPNTVDPAISEDKREPEPPLILSVSRMDEHDHGKHLDSIIKAIPQLPTELSKARLVIAGDGVLRSELLALVAREGLTARVSLPGRVSDEELERLYSEASIFALPSSKEGFGIVYLEAWCHRLPVIASIYGAAPEVVTDGVDGFTIDPENIESLAGRLTLLLQDQSLRTRFSEQGVRKVREKYSTENLKMNIKKLFEGLS